MDATTRRPSRGRIARVAGAALTVGGLVLALTACGSSSGASGASSTPPSPSSSKGKSGKHGATGVTGQVTAENGDSWTVTTKAGKQFTVAITPQTQFGTKQQPGTKDQFPVGTAVRVAGQVSGTTVTASRVAPPAPPKTSTSASPTTTTS
ncbi:hypothetical protein F0L68_02200 [Solihabitans fulvus]|uniref:DUF5666 domain-containing protein n=1 Tax=Solihabitans fulvus TaxID=1892852 RepID=A0A5B2XUE0_9PSEU|nr:DUF5666 domain-containing protein [Solihabitans fulvus]KAA2266570.1 hypothetical protein F0L68_02200 [Solihabitans fulvus]